MKRWPRSMPATWRSCASSTGAPMLRQGLPERTARPAWPRVTMTGPRGIGGPGTHVEQDDDFNSTLKGSKMKAVARAFVLCLLAVVVVLGARLGVSVVNATAQPVHAMMTEGK